MKLFVSIFCFSILVLSSRARAGLLIEPVVGYNLSTKLDIVDGTDYSGGTGVGYGGRLGYQQLGLQLGVDYLNSTIDLDDSDWNDELSMSEWGAFVGFKFPILLRVYAGYIFAATAETKDAANDKWEFLKGNGYKAGIGFTGLPFININVEYRKGNFAELEENGTEVVGGEADYQSIMVGLSLPLVF